MIVSSTFDSIGISIRCFVVVELQLLKYRYVVRCTIYNSRKHVSHVTPQIWILFLSLEHVIIYHLVVHISNSPYDVRTGTEVRVPVPVTGTQYRQPVLTVVPI